MGEVFSPIGNAAMARYEVDDCLGLLLFPEVYNSIATIW